MTWRASTQVIIFVTDPMPSQVAATSKRGAVLDMEKETAAASSLSSEAALESSRALAATVVHRYTIASEVHREALLDAGVAGALIVAIRASSRHADRMHRLCAALAQLSCIQSAQQELRTLPIDLVGVLHSFSPLEQVKLVSRA